MSSAATDSEVFLTDAFFAAGDTGFNRRRSGYPRTIEEAKRKRSPHFRAILNESLLLHSRIVLTDSSLLCNADLALLLLDDPTYEDLLRRGPLRSAARGDVQFIELAEKMIEKDNYRPIDDEFLRRNASVLDSLDLVRVVSPAEANQARMRTYGERFLLNAAYWREALRMNVETSEALVRHVRSQMAMRKSDAIRQSEFWEFASDLADRGQHALAQSVRLHVNLFAMHTMSAGIFLPAIYPARAARDLSRFFADEPVPFHGRKIENFKALGEAQPDLSILHDVVKDLTGAEVARLRAREGGGFQKYLKRVQESRGHFFRGVPPPMDQRPVGTLEAELTLALKQYVAELRTEVNEIRFGDEAEANWDRSDLRFIEKLDGVIGAVETSARVFVDVCTGGVTSVPKGARAYLKVLAAKRNRRLADLNVENEAERLRSKGLVEEDFYYEVLGPVSRSSWVG